MELALSLGKFGFIRLFFQHQNCVQIVSNFGQKQAIPVNLRPIDYFTYADPSLRSLLYECVAFESIS